MGDQEQSIVRVEAGIGAIDADAWDACANPAGRSYNPFISHAFLYALERSGCVSEETGWLPRHLILCDETGAIHAAMPCYLKSHSQGEYVFDHGWADAYEYAGGCYYPKLQSAVPFTPVTGRRLLVPQCDDYEQREELLINAATTLTQELEISSFHMTFLTKREWRHAHQLGLLKRHDQQFHWTNQDYDCFDDFLASLSSRKRKAIRKERREATAEGVEIEWISGSSLREEHWDGFFEFYLDTGSRKWGRPYLNRAFFNAISETLSERILLIMCKHAGCYIAGALNFIGGDTLYGRYWGSVEDHNCLHFETCYYQAIDFAIENSLRYVEAGAQGTHKLSRGYLPKETYSAHFIADPGLRQAVADFLVRDGHYTDYEKQALASHSPFRKDTCKGLQQPIK